MTQEPQYFRPRNWNKFQSSSNNSLPWIKNYTALLSDPDYLELNDHQRGVLHGLWLLFGMRRRPLEWSCRYLNRALGTSCKHLSATLGVLKRRNFIELCDATFTEESRGDKKRREKTPPISPSRGKEVDPHFEEFWNLYPRQRRGSKQKSFTAWKRALKRSSSGEIIAGLRDYIESDEVRRGFAKGAAAWLNDDRWKSDYRTHRTKTHEELKKEFVNGDQGSDLGSGILDGEYVDLSGQGSENDRRGLSHGSAGSVGYPGEGSGNGAFERVGEGCATQAGGYPVDRERDRARIQQALEIATKRTKP